MPEPNVRLAAIAGCYQAFLFVTFFVTFAQFVRRFNALRRQPIKHSNAGADARLAALENWVEGIDALAGAALTPASGDASFRRYFRVTLADGGTRGDVVITTDDGRVLIIEFAKMRREQGHSITEAAVMGSRERFRAVMMKALLHRELPVACAVAGGMPWP